MKWRRKGAEKHVLSPCGAAARQTERMPRNEKIHPWRCRLPSTVICSPCGTAVQPWILFERRTEILLGQKRGTSCPETLVPLSNLHTLVAPLFHCGRCDPGVGKCECPVFQLPLPLTCSPLAPLLPACTAVDGSVAVQPAFFLKCKHDRHPTGPQLAHSGLKRASMCSRITGGHKHD